MPRDLVATSRRCVWWFPIAPSARSADRSGQVPPDIHERCRDRWVVIGVDGQDLWLMTCMLGHDDQRRRAVTLDIELDPAQPIELDVEHETVRRADRESTIRHDDLGLARSGPGLDLLVRADQA